MKHYFSESRTVYAKRYFGIVVGALIAMVLLASCSIQPVGTTTNENAAENRQYMAQLNQKTEELSEVLDQFQTAVSASDAVGMKAAAAKADKITESVKALDPPESESAATASLAPVKELYVEALESINEVMDEYASLYSEVSAGSVSQAAFSKRILAVQTSYDEAVKKISAADEELTKLANE